MSEGRQLGGGNRTPPAPPGLPTLRRFQRDQAVATLGWLRERWPDLDG